MFDNDQFIFQGITLEEMAFLKQSVVGLSDSQMQAFKMIYSGKRKTESDMQLYCILGLLIIPGLQRFMTGQVGMGILYLFTWGLCFIGSVVDLINYKKATMDFNKKAAFESYQMARMGA